jgi:hypothetical protein
MPIDPTTQAQENTKVNSALRPTPYPHIEGMQLNADIEFIKVMPDDSIKRLVFNTSDGNGTLFICTDITGWWDMPAPEVPDIPRGLDNGSYDVRGRWTAKTLTFKGSIIPKDPSYTAAARQKIMESFDLVYTGGWLLVKESPVKAMYVRLTGQPTFESVKARGRLDFTAQFKAVDPIKYDWYDDTNDNYTTWPVSIEITRTNSKINEFTSKLGYSKKFTVSSNTVSVIPTDGTSIANVLNRGNTDVTTFFKITGPMTAPATITATRPDGIVQTIKIIRTLRASGYNTTNAATPISTLELSGGIATLGITNHGFYAGDVVNVTGIDTRFNKNTATITSTSATAISYAKTAANVVSITVANNVATVVTAAAHGISGSADVYIDGTSNLILTGIHTATSVSSNTVSFPTTGLANLISYGGTLSLQIDQEAYTSNGAVTLTTVDTLEIDTYNTSVLYRGLPDGSRSTLDANVDWIKLQPGTTQIVIAKSGDAAPTVNLKYRSGWIG